MGHQKSPETLAKFLDYVLGRRPDEFGLVPDPDGYVKIKELLKALGEEEGWGHVRRAGIDEVLISVPDPPIEVDDNRIRAADRSRLPVRKAAETFPKLLYTCVRKKAHPVVVDRGVSPMGEREHVVLTTEPELAEPPPGPDNWLRLLGLRPDFTREQLEEAYWYLRHAYHPDRGGDEEIFMGLREARRQAMQYLQRRDRESSVG